MGRGGPLLDHRVQLVSKGWKNISLGSALLIIGGLLLAYVVIGEFFASVHL